MSAELTDVGRKRNGCFPAAYPGKQPRNGAPRSSALAPGGLPHKPFSADFFTQSLLDRWPSLAHAALSGARP
jgi:hypothetical protein